MSLKKILIKNSTINIFSYAYLLLLSFFSIPLLLKNLGINLFGIYLVYAGIIPLASTLNFGLISALIRHLSLPNITQKQKTNYWQTCFWQFISLSLIIFFLSFFIIFFIVGKIPSVATLSINTIFIISLSVSLIIFINHITQPLLALAQTNQHFIIYNLRNLIVGSGNTILSAWLTIYFPSLPHIFMFQFILYFITAVIFLTTHATYSQMVRFGQNTQNQPVKHYLSLVSNILLVI